MALTPQQQRQLYERGYLHLPAAIPREHIERCRRKIHHDIGRHGLDPNELTRFRARSYCPELQNDPDFTGLARSPEPWALLTAALGEGNVAVSEWVQIALRFPSMQEEPRRPKWHIDGVPTPDNGMPPDQIEHFTCLLGVVLADVTEPNRGNFTVWPGGHRKIEQWFCENPKEKLLEGYPELDLAEPHQVCAKAGDVVFAHYLLPHGVGPHTGPDPRYMVFFRIKHLRHQELGDRPLREAWCEWPGVQDVAASASA